MAMGSRSVVLVSVVTVVATVGGRWASGAPDRTTTRITVWPETDSDAEMDEMFGEPSDDLDSSTSAVIIERRTVDVPASGEVQFSGVAATLDPITVQLRDLTEPEAAISEQRFAAGAKTPTEILARHLGARVVVSTAKTELTGVLRSVDDTSLVIETTTGPQRQLHVVRRDSVVETRVPAGPAIDESALSWRLATKRPGPHELELIYRASGLSWKPSYVAVLDDAGTSVDFSAWATIKNRTRTTFDRAELRLVRNDAAVQRYFDVPSPARLLAGQTAQVELVPSRRAVRAHASLTYEANADVSEHTGGGPNLDCSTLDGSSEEAVKRAVEIALPTNVTLPVGHVQLFQRRRDRVEAVGADQLSTTPGKVRIELPDGPPISGDRQAVACKVDESAQTITERIEIRLENSSKRSEDVTIREYAWRFPTWRIETEDVKSTRHGHVIEYRIAVPAGSKRKVSYAIVYSW